MMSGSVPAARGRRTKRLQARSVPMNKPIRLTPSLREKLWGKQRLQPWFPDSPVPIGEAWFLAEVELPLLVKLLFTSERLSIQVHPDDGEGGPLGKTEMWHILEAGPGASIALGFREPISRERLWQAAQTGELETLVNWIPVTAGETYFVPAHTVHAIGGGIVLCEIQQNSDVTYRLWDYGRPREVHLDRAAALADLATHPGAAHPTLVAPGRENLVRSKHFVTELVRVKSGHQIVPGPENSHLWICIEGHGTIGGAEFRAGEVWWLPMPAPVMAAVDSRFLRTWTPAVK
jgi:mannose-6-phosphate isomerase